MPPVHARLLCAASFALALAPVWTPCARSAVVLPQDFIDETVVNGLDRPTSLAFLPDGRVLVTEQKTARVRLVVQHHVAATDPVLTVPDVMTPSEEHGLLALAVDPGWPSRPYVYLFHDRLGSALRLVRYTASGDLASPTGENLALAEPLLLMDDIPDSSWQHNGGGLRFGADGRLYLSLGEDERFCPAQDSTSLRGAVLRLDVSRLPDGAGGPVPRALLIPPGNPLSTADSNAMLVYAYGLRNPWRLHADPVSGAIFVADPGGGVYEEINRVDPGGNYGWPFREGRTVIVPGTCVEPGGPGASPYDTATVQWRRPGGPSAIVGAGVYRPAGGGAWNWPAAYDGDLFWADYYTGMLRRVKFAGSTPYPAPSVPGQPNADDWATGLVSAVDFQVGPDGSLWWLSQYDEFFTPGTGRLGRIAWVGGAAGVDETRPSALALTAHPNPFAGRIELSFRLERAGRVRMTLHDLAGRRLAVLADGERASGIQRLVWDGEIEAGRGAAPGLYVVRLEAENRSEAIRLVRAE
jgi:glucose/arabinose dehydrogenase